MYQTIPKSNKQLIENMINKYIIGKHHPTQHNEQFARAIPRKLPRKSYSYSLVRSLSLGTIRPVCAVGHSRAPREVASSLLPPVSPPPPPVTIQRSCGERGS